MRCTSATIEATQRMLEILAARASGAGQQFADIALHRRLPVALVRHVDGEFGGLFRNAYGARRLSMKLPTSRSSVNSCVPWPKVSTRVVAGAIHHITGSQLRRARLQKVFGLRLGHIIRTAQHGEDRADRDMLTSMLELPSSGSNNSRWLPFG